MERRHQNFIYYERGSPINVDVILFAYILDMMLHECMISHVRFSSATHRAHRHSIYAYYTHIFMSNTHYYDLREVLKYKKFSSYAVTVFLCSVKNTILNTILRIEFWIVCIVRFCLVFLLLLLYCMGCCIVCRMLNTLQVSIIILCMYFNFVVHNEIRLLLLCTIVAIKASIGVYGYNSSFHTLIWMLHFGH